MNKFWIVLAHTYMTRIKSKAFLIVTAITLLFVIGAVNFQSITSLFSDDGKDEIAVIDDSNQLYTPLKEAVEQASDEIKLVAFNGTEADGKQAVEDEKYQALITLSVNDNDLPEANYYTNNIASSENKQVIQEQLQQLKISQAIEHAGLDQAELAAIYDPVVFNTIALDKSAKTDEEIMQAQGVVYVMVLIMYMVVMMYGQMIAMDVATEKSSRVMELLISSASPVTHMFAKIIGIALLGLTQIGLFIVVGAGMISLKKDELSGGMLDTFGFLDAPASLIVYGVLFFLLGYLLYATLAAMLGSLVSRTEDAQQVTMPLIFLIMIAFFMAIYGLTAPESSLITISSYIPFFAPMLMTLRIGMLDIAVWEIVLNIGILVGSIVILALIGARVYKGGVLMYGKSSSLKDFKKAMQLSKKE